MKIYLYLVHERTMILKRFYIQFKSEKKVEMVEEKSEIVKIRKIRNC